MYSQVASPLPPCPTWKMTLLRCVKRWTVKCVVLLGRWHGAVGRFPSAGSAWLLQGLGRGRGFGGGWTFQQCSMSGWVRWALLVVHRL
eukprot:15481289-Alexandrium_andersonii.AAC.1